MRHCLYGVAGLVQLSQDMAALGTAVCGSLPVLLRSAQCCSRPGGEFVPAQVRHH